MSECQNCHVVGEIAMMGLCRSCAEETLTAAMTSGNHQQQQAQGLTQLAAPKIVANNSGWVLARNIGRNGERVSLFVDKDISKNLHAHQKEGVEFIWKHCFSDWDTVRSSSQKDVGGCTIAHYMGLGKSLTTIALLHTVMTNPCLTSQATPRKIKTTLLIAPSNTIRNWECEIRKWTGDLEDELRSFNIGKVTRGYRQEEMEKWKKAGGIAIMSLDLFVKECKFIVDKVNPDVLVLDEAHTMLKCPRNKTAQELCKIKTKRKILLTGTPLQNNVSEYYLLVNFARPGVLKNVSSLGQFEKLYRKPIEAGLATNAEEDTKAESEAKQLELHRELSQYVHRKDKSCIRNTLPQVHDVLLYLQSSNTQTQLLKEYDKHCKSNDVSSSVYRNFFRKYHTLSPLLNHPGCLVHGKGKGSEWLRQASKPTDLEKLHEFWRSPKFIILAQILSEALELEEKTLIYSKCLKTLDLIGKLLESRDWRKLISSLPRKIGGWTKNKDFLRIDGSTESGQRGAIVDTFNKTAKVRVLLIASVAGGIGINLTSATRVVIMDNHFNPSVSEQCVSRAHRFGQTKPVYCYRLAIEGTIETKVYARSENKCGVASGVIDGQLVASSYTSEQLDDLSKIDCWATCTLCNKRRLLPENCKPPDEDEFWPCAALGIECSHPEEPCTQRKFDTETEDTILQHISKVVNKRTRKTPLVIGWAVVQRSEGKPGGYSSSGETEKSTSVSDLTLSPISKGKTSGMELKREHLEDDESDDEVIVVQVKKPRS